MEGQITQPINKREYYKTLLEVQEQEKTAKAKQGYWKAYIYSVVMTPIGVYYFIKYFFYTNGDDKDRKAALICLSLTIVSLIVNIWLIQMFFNQLVIPQNQDLQLLTQ
ncbi:hypothetical protein HY468_02170 [Candidatus Roizmanbacteria bacterium]|nr:hypothetical protein [Candidatus Roizmanbacteria bacterium]